MNLDVSSRKESLEWLEVSKTNQTVSLLDENTLSRFGKVFAPARYSDNYCYFLPIDEEEPTHEEPSSNKWPLEIPEVLPSFTSAWNYDVQLTVQYLTLTAPRHRKSSPLAANYDYF